MASEISVERQFRFHCSCGATITTGERTVTCAACGIALGVRRVRRHRQNRRDSVTYYGERFNTSGNLKVRRVQRRGEHPNAKNGQPSETATKSRFLARVKGVLEKLAARPEPREVLSNSGKNQVVERRLTLYSRVKVGPRKLDGSPHPHAGKTGAITRFLEDKPAAMVHLDAGIEPQGFICVSLECLELLTGNQE